MSYFKKTVEDVRSRLAVLGCPTGVVILEEDPGPDALATCDFVAPYYAMVIKVTPGFKGCKLWRVLYHEFGHALGLGHTKKGIMATHGTRIEEQEHEPTEKQKQRWAIEIARLAFEVRANVTKK